MASVTDRSTWMTPALWTPQRTQSVATRYERAYLRTPEPLLKAGAEFYPGWHEDAQHIGQTLDLGHEAGAAIMAHLSPANEAEINRIQAMQVTHGIGDKQSRLLMRAGEMASIAQSNEVLSRKAPAGSRFHVEHQKASAENARLRQKAGIIGTPLGHLGSREISNALDVRSGAWEHPLESLGSLKIRHFGGAIADPMSPRIPIDTHYHDVGVGREDIPYELKRGLTAKGRYEHFHNASSIALGRVNEALGVDMPHTEFMGGIWFGHQQRKVRSNPDAMRARKASETKLANIRASDVGQHYLPERYGLRPSFGKIETW